MPAVRDVYDVRHLFLYWRNFPTYYRTQLLHNVNETEKRHINFKTSYFSAVVPDKFRSCSVSYDMTFDTDKVEGGVNSTMTAFIDELEALHEHSKYHANN